MENEITEKSYYICSEFAVNLLKPLEVSKAFKSGYEHDKDDIHYVAVLEFSECEILYNYLSEDEQDKFYVRELVPGLMDVSTITLSGMRENGVFSEIQDKIGLTAYRNVAMTLYNLSQKFNCTPIELINKVTNSVKNKNN